MIDVQTLDRSAPRDASNVSDWSSVRTDDRVMHIVCQGVVFSGFERYHVLPVGRNILLTAWNPSAPINRRLAVVWTFRPLAPDAAMGGAINTSQTVVKYAGPTLRDALSLSIPENTIIRSWQDFSPPVVQVKTGATFDDNDYSAHRSALSVRGWRQWANQLVGPQRPLGRFNKPLGTRTYYQTNTAAASGVHAASNEYELSLTPDSGSVSEAVANSDDELVFLWTTDGTEPNDAAWATGNYRCQLDVSSAGGDMTYGFRTIGASAGHFARVDSGLTTDQETNTQSEAAFSGTGLKLATTGSISWAAGATGDRFECLLAANNTAVSGPPTQTLTCDLGNDAFADGPWPASAFDEALTAAFQEMTPLPQRGPIEAHGY